jgi:hypothetical protein
MSFLIGPWGEPSSANSVFVVYLGPFSWSRDKDPPFQDIRVVHAGFSVDLSLEDCNIACMVGYCTGRSHGSQDICKVGKQLDCSRCADWVGPEALSIVPPDLGLGFWLIRRRICVLSVIPDPDDRLVGTCSVQKKSVIQVISGTRSDRGQWIEVKYV